MSATPEQYDPRLELEHRLRMLERDIKMYRDIVENQHRMLNDNAYCEKCKTLIKLRK